MTPPPDLQSPAPRPPGSRRRWWLAVSLTLNLFLLAVVIGGALRPIGPWGGVGPWGGPDGGPDRSWGSEMRSLRHMPTEHREVMRAIFTAHREALRAEGRALHAARRAVHTALAADPFEPAVLEAAFADLRDATDSGQIALHGVLVELAGQLPAEARAGLARLAESGRFAHDRPGGPPSPRE